jgi:hypothetical protein
MAGLVLFGQDGQRIDAACVGCGFGVRLQRNGFTPGPTCLVAPGRRSPEIR